MFDHFQQPTNNQVFIIADLFKNSINLKFRLITFTVRSQYFTSNIL